MKKRIPSIVVIVCLILPLLQTINFKVLGEEISNVSIYKINDCILNSEVSISSAIRSGKKEFNIYLSTENSSFSLRVNDSPVHYTDFRDAYTLTYHKMQCDNSLKYYNWVTVTLIDEDKWEYCMNEYKKNIIWWQSIVKEFNTMYDIDNMSDYDKTLAVLKYMQYIDYDYEMYEAGKTQSSAYIALTEGRATCMGFSGAYEALSTIIGLKVDTIKNGETHSWNKVKVCGNWYDLEPQGKTIQIQNFTTFLRGSNYMNALSGIYKTVSGRNDISLTDYSEYKGHDYSDYAFEWNTDNVSAVFYKKCSECGEYESDGIPKVKIMKTEYYDYLNREYIGTNCTVEKVSEKICGNGKVATYKATVLVDGKTYTDYKQIETGECNHVVGSTEVLKEATCLKKGKVQHTCKNCGFEWEEDTKIIECNYRFIEKDVNNCTENSHYEAYECSVCGNVKDASLTLNSEISHNYEKTITTQPTCTNDGYYKYTCKDCGYSKDSVLVPALGHDLKVVTYNAPTCSQKGVTEYYCNRCGETIYEYKDKLEEHNYKLINSTDPTCIDGGVNTYRCNDCGKTIFENIDELGHDYEQKENSFIIDNVKYTERWNQCKRCDQISNKELISSDEQVTTTSKTDIETKKPKDDVTQIGKQETTTAKANVKPGRAVIKNVKKSKKSVKITFKRIKTAKKYQIQYARNKSFTKSKKTKTTTKLSYTIKKLKKGKTYYVRVRGKNSSYYGKWSKVKKVKVKK